ncbi:hypothetical protein DK26_09115 [Bosea sp. WAO]|uniref:hypothetical protein n=1 Tax=Bosea sp. WAO TaxID=406341 RepID=UPI000746CDE3|nr:hypothetical protein [Bosea sp. WAO]KUL95331.1 hypothetical protein DK26_09115 [Bosea sp. WAO]
MALKNEKNLPAGVRLKVVVETPSSATICALALRGVGVGLTNPAAAEGFAELGAIFRPFEQPIYFNSILMFAPICRRPGS